MAKQVEPQARLGVFVEPRFQIKYEATDAYLKRALWQFYAYGLLRHPLLWVAAVLLGVCAYYVYRGSAADGAFYGFLAALILVWFVLLVINGSRSLMRHFAGLSARTTVIRFYDDHLEDESPKTTLRIPWCFFMRRWKTPDMWFLFFSQRIFLMFPSACLPGELDVFVAEKLASNPRTDFLSCPKCRSNLVGCTAARCSRCDRPLPLESMHLTAEQFVELSQALAVDVAGKLPRPKIRIVQEGFFWSLGMAAVAGALTGVASLVLFWTVFWVIERNIVLFMLILLGVPGLVLWRYGQRLTHAGASVVFGVCSALGMLGLLLLLMLSPIVLGQQPLYLSPSLGPPTLLKLAALMLLWSPLWCWSAWGLILRVRGRAMLPHRFECAQCSYSLLGNSSGVCPECGTSIPFDELGVSPKQLHALTNPTLDDASSGPHSDSV